MGEAAISKSDCNEQWRITRLESMRRKRYEGAFKEITAAANVN